MDDKLCSEYTAHLLTTGEGVLKLSSTRVQHIGYKAPQWKDATFDGFKYSLFA